MQDQEKIGEYDIVFKSDGKTECHFCGISAFDHLHRDGTKPNEFERLHQNPETKVFL